jgi:hypothetical protein
MLPGIKSAIGGIGGGGGPLVIVNSNTSFTSSSLNSHTVSLPASIVAGNLLLVVFGNDSSSTPNTPSGWSKIGLTVTNGDTLTVFAKIASGGEGASVVVTLAAAATEPSASIAYQISGNRNGVTTSELQLVIQSNGAAGSTADPPNNAPGWGVVEILWLAICGQSRGDTTVTSYPTNFSLNQLSSGTGFGAGTRVSTAARLLSASSENPGVFTLSDALNTCVVATMAIRPV